MSDSKIQQIVAAAQAGKPDAQFMLSRVYQRDGDVRNMIHWLRMASSSGHPDAIGALGLCYERGQGVVQDMTQALEHYDHAIAGGAKIALFQKAQLLHKAKSGPEDQGLIRELLIDAATSDIVRALRVIGYLCLQQASTRAFAVDCMRRAAELGDPVSSFNLGWSLLQGFAGEDASKEAGHWLQRAVAARYPYAESFLALCSDVQINVPKPSTEKRLAFDREFALYPENIFGERQIMSDDPPIALLENVLDVVDCAYLMFSSRPSLQRAAVIDPDGDDKEGMVSDVRTSQSTYIAFEQIDMMSRYIELKIVTATGEALDHSEPMSILCYGQGEYYRPHFDYFNPQLDASEKLLRDGGQRTASAITYLSVPEAGGGTSFPNLDITVPASEGSTLWFRNCTEDGEVDERSLHAGDTVEAGEKWVVTKWFRERPTSYLMW